jgi:hypothetical protein
MRSALLVMLLAAISLTVSAQRTYTDAKYGVTFSYPSDFKVTTGEAASKQSYFADQGKGVKLVKVAPVRIPTRYHGEYEFNIWVSNDPAEKCGPPSEDEFMVPDGKPDTETRVIDGHTFHHYSDEDAGMSKIIFYEGYRAIVGDKCWQIQSTDYQAEAYDDFKAFDAKIIDKAWQNFLDSIRFSR